MNVYRIAACAVVVTTMALAGARCQAQDPYQPSGQELEFSLFQNFYTPQGASQATAALYNAPQPVPYWVGGSHYTYQPLYPHQHMYWHAKNYYSYSGSADQFYSDNQRHGRGGDALNKTTVVWKGTGYHMGNLPFSSFTAQRLKYGVQARKYGLRAPGRQGGGYGGGYGGGSAGCPTGTCR